jgi:carbamoyltransferase
MRILGLSAYYHDSAAALLVDGAIVAAAQEERFTRKKHDAGFPAHAVGYCLEQAGITFDSLDQVVFYDKPFIKFERLIETYLAYAPAGFRSFFTAMPIWLKEKLYLKSLLRKEFKKIGANSTGKEATRILFAEHHQSHAASAFYPSPFEEAAVLCMDGVGEWAMTSAWEGSGPDLELLWEINWPHSLGLLYSAFTYFTGFRVNSGEYKLMGLAPYGTPKYVDLIMENLIDLKPDGTFRLAMDYFDYAAGLTMTHARMETLFGRPPRKAEGALTQDDMDIAASIQSVTEEIVLRLATTLRKETGKRNLCLAGGVALNCVANGKLIEAGIFDNIWIQPAAGDAGGAVGSALAAWHQHHGQSRSVNGHDSMQGCYLGPGFSNAEVKTELESLGANFASFERQEMLSLTAESLKQEKVVGWFQGRMEYGPRALGARSILGDARSSKMQSVMNLKIKYRESFRPFAPAILAERVSEWLELNQASPYMLVVAAVQKERRLPLSEADQTLFGIEQLNIPRSQIPAVTHVDYSARVQTVDGRYNRAFYALLKQFDELTGCPVLVNTSFNVRGEPIVCTPRDAYRCFMRTEMDMLVIENIILRKEDQPEWKEDENWLETFELD